MVELAGGDLPLIRACGGVEQFRSRRGLHRGASTTTTVEAESADPCKNNEHKSNQLPAIAVELCSRKCVMTDRSRMPARRTDDWGAEVTVLIVAVEVCELMPSVRVDARSEQAAYGAEPIGAQVIAMGPLNPLAGVAVRVNAAG